MKKELLLLPMLCFLLVQGTAWATDYKGRVLEEVTNVPLVGITVHDEKGKVIAVSDSNGRFEVSVTSLQKLSFQGVGYQTQEFVLLASTPKEFTVYLRQKVTILDDVVVTTTRKERFIKDEPVVTHIITSKQIEKLAVASFQEVLGSVIAGVQFETPRGTTGANTSINIQGLGGSYIMFLIDGEPISAKNGENSLNRRGGQIDLSRIDLNSIERIEYLPSGGSILYGSNSIGGVVNIITKRVKKPLELSVGTRLEFPYQSRYDINGGTAGKKGDVRASFSYLRNKEYTAYEVLEKNQSGEVIKTSDGRDSIQQVKFPGFDAVVTSVVGNVFPSESVKISSGLNFTQSSVFINRKTRTENWDKSAITSVGGRLGFQYQLKPNQMFDVSSSIDVSEQNVHKFDKVKNENKIDRNYKNRIAVLRGQYTVDFNENHTTIFGLENTSEKSHTNWYSEPYKTQNTAVAYVQHDAKFFNKKLFLSYGLRYDHNSNFGGNFLQRLSLMQKIRKIDFRLLYSESFRTPTLSELYTHQEDPRGLGALYGNPNLKPEKSNRYTFQVGYTNKNISLSASAYILKVSDLIETPRLVEPTTRKVLYIPENVDKSIRIFGSEFMAKAQFENGTYLQATASAINSIDRVVYDLKGKKYNTSLRRPYSGTITIGHSFKGKNYVADVNFSTRYISTVSYWRRKSATDTTTYEHEKKMQVDDPERGNTYYNVVEDAYHNALLATSLRLFDAYTFTFGVNNLFNYKPNASNYTSALTSGREFLVGLNVNIDKIKFK